MVFMPTLFTVSTRECQDTAARINDHRLRLWVGISYVEVDKVVAEGSVAVDGECVVELGGGRSVMVGGCWLK